MRRRAPGHLFSSEHLIFQIYLLPPPHTLLEIAASSISKQMINQAMIPRLDIPNELKPLIRACCQQHHSPKL